MSDQQRADPHQSGKLHQRPPEQDMDEPAEEGRSDSDAASSERPDAARPCSDCGDDVSNAPESGTRDANG